MQRRSIEVQIIGYGLSFVYGLGLLIYLAGYLISLVNPEAVLNFSLFAGKFSSVAVFHKQALMLWILYFPQFIAFFAVAKFNEWGRRLVILVSVLMCLFITYQMIQVFDILSLASLFIYGAVILFFNQLNIKVQFRKDIKLRNKTVLVIDDDRTFLRMIRYALLTSGFFVLTANTGEKGLAITRGKRPDLIVLDVILPGIKGREVCQKLKKDEKTKDIPVIFLTAKDSPDDVRAEMEAGGITHLTKPVDAPRLLGEINKIFS